MDLDSGISGRLNMDLDSGISGRLNMDLDSGISRRLNMDLDSGISRRLNVSVSNTVAFCFRVDYVDSLGRSRRCLKKDLPHIMKMDEKLGKTR